MPLKKLTILALGWLCTFATYAQTYYTQSLKDNIKSVQIGNHYQSPVFPVVALGSDDKITLRFDDVLCNATTYSYRIVHCNANWQASSLQETEYMRGFSTNYIDSPAPSNSAYYAYDHYQLQLPNDDWQYTISGNYAIEVFDDNASDKPVLTACFSVVDPKVGIKATASARTYVSFQKDWQQVDIDIDYSQYDIKDPLNEIIVVVTQNGRTDNQATLTTADYNQQHTLRYLNNPKLLFEAGNQYRVFDISSERILSERIEEISYFKPYFHATLYPDENRRQQAYDFWQDVHGRYLVHVQFSDQSDLDADYFFTHFSLPVDEPFFNSEVYILGEFTDNKLGSKARMQYNPQKGQYEKTLLLKQGGYNYLYVVAPKGSSKASTLPIEGNHWQTQNEYDIKVYHRPFGSKSDKLIGFTTLIANTTY